ncbi:MAG: hypothetical protein OZ921_11595 [Sorangiineae bacterium]|nr:hypothetical protein [Polyangiaceae bacterium]MEB2323150.1 hypothetical protein [Sorangiineae bacterium]
MPSGTLHELIGAASSEPPLHAAAEAVLTFLESVGRRSEAELYLKLFRQLPKESFAVIAADAGVVRHALGSLTEQLRFLADLGLYAPVVLGLFDPDAAERGASRLARRLPTVGLEPCVHDADAEQVIAELREELRSERVPLVRFRPNPGVSLASRFARLGAITQALDARKLVLLRRRGGLGPRGEGRLELPGGLELGRHSGGISLINLRSDYAVMQDAKLLKRDEALLLERLRELLLDSAPRLLVSVTSPLNLLTELFTVRGAGTLVKAGAPIGRYESYEEVDRARLRALLESSFGRRLSGQFFERRPLAIYLDADYRGAAILEPSPVGAFLTKFAVEPIAQGEGLARDLWQALTREHPAVFWRARRDNPINGWYTSLADGMVRVSEWQVFWRRLDPAQVPAIVVEAEGRPRDFEPG